MSETAQLAGMYSAIEESAALMEVACSRDTVWPVLTAYGDALTQAAFAFRVATDVVPGGELDVRFSVRNDVDPYALALANGLIPDTDHPVGTLLSDIHQRFPIDTYGIDFGIVSGFRKIYAFFPAEDLQSLSKLVDIPSMAPSLAENLGFFTGHGVADKMSVVSVDYQHKTVNVCFGWPPEDGLDADAVRSMLREIGMPAPSERMLTLGQQAFGMYLTLSWDSSKVHRICFPTLTPDPTKHSDRLDPQLEKFVKIIPNVNGERKFVYAATATLGGEYYKLQSYYQMKPRMLDLMQSSDSTADPV
jgi:hypothetical protein